MPAEMTPDQVNAFLDSKPGWLMLSTIGRDGYPHTIPIGYFRVGDDICLGCRKDTQKLRNIERDPKVSLLVESGKEMGSTTGVSGARPPSGGGWGTLGSPIIKGVMIQGEARVITDPAEVLELMRTAARLRGTPEEQLPVEARPTAAYIRVSRRRVISWDYSREG